MLSNAFSLSECIKNYIGWGFAPHLTEKAYSATDSGLAVFKAERGWREGVERTTRLDRKEGLGQRGTEVGKWAGCGNSALVVGSGR